MRLCAKVRCREPATATLLLRYGSREVEIVALRPEPDPNLVDVCAEHADRLTPPIGWTIEDSRTQVPSGV